MFKSPSRKSYLNAFLSSVLLLAASPGLWAVPALMWCALIPLILSCLANNVSPGRAFKIGFFCGFLYNVGLLYWIVIALGRYGGLHPVVSILALLGLSAYMALYFGGFTSLLSATKHHLPVTFSAPVIWVGLDQVKAWLFTGFPWQDLGYSQFNTPLLVQIADIAGHSGITFILVMVNALIASHMYTNKSSYRKSPKLWKTYSTIITCILIVVIFIYSKKRIEYFDQQITLAPRVNTAVMQGNIDQNDKWSPENQNKTINTYLDLTRQASEGQSIELAVWPETALPFFPLSSSGLSVVQDFTEKSSSPEILTGAPHFSALSPSKTHYYNSSFLISDNRENIPRYDKQHLVPFGEYVPFQSILGVLPIAHSMGNFTPGSSSQPLPSKTSALGVLICFESIFPRLSQKLTSAGADLLVNLTNDAWYGVSSAPYQQVSMAVLRAVENRRSMARSANTGISCFVDPVGRVLEASPIFTQLYLAQNLPLLNEQSFFTRSGYLFQPACLILLSLIILYGIVKGYGNSSYPTLR